MCIRDRWNIACPHSTCTPTHPGINGIQPAPTPPAPQPTQVSMEYSLPPLHLHPNSPRYQWNIACPHSTCTTTHPGINEIQPATASRTERVKWEKTTFFSACFVQKTQEIKKKNQQILGEKAKWVPLLHTVTFCHTYKCNVACHSRSCTLASGIRIL